MRKYIVFYLSSIILHSYSLSPHSLSDKIFEVFFDHKTWTVNKKIIQQGLKEYKYPGDLFKGKTIIGLDFSGLDLSGKDFSDSKLVKVNLSGADLTNTTFHNTHFDRCNLVGAYFRYPLDGSEKVFTISSNDHYELVKQYSDLMNQKEEKKEQGVEKEATDLAQQTGCLNHLFQTLSLNLEKKDLRNFNLIDINFQKSDILQAQVQGVRFFDDFKVSNGNFPCTLFSHFKESVRNHTLIEKGYFNLIKNYFSYFKEIIITDLQNFDWLSLSLINVHLVDVKLQKFDFSEVDFTGANLGEADLTNAKLIGTTFKNTNLSGTNLKGARFSENFQLNYNEKSDVFEKWYEANINDHPDKKYYNLLATNQFDMFFFDNLDTPKKRLHKKRLVDALKNKLDVRNAHLIFSHFKKVEFDGIDFENANISNSKFNQSTLSNICFRNGNVSDSNFSDASLQKVNFNLANLLSVKFNQAILESVSFKGADPTEADFTGANLKDVDFFAADISGIKLSDKVTLPESNNDQDHINFYHQCPDPQAKALLKIILESRDITLEP